MEGKLGCPAQHRAFQAGEGPLTVSTALDLDTKTTHLGPRDEEKAAWDQGTVRGTRGLGGLLHRSSGSQLPILQAEEYELKEPQGRSLPL